MPTWGRWVLGVLVAAVVLGGPAAYYRSGYTNTKRFRVVTPGKFYRSGQFTASGLRHIIRAHGIRTVINLQEENRDPFMPEEWLSRPHVRESDVCRELGVNYYSLFGGETVSPEGCAAGRRPQAIDQFLRILDDPGNHPVLLHCKAGLHRTGAFTAVYRMEYEGWTAAAAMRELRANGFGTFAATTGNVYIVQYVEKYRRGVRNPVPPPRNVSKPGGA
jgi:protein tyrosine/serine phosphatase